VWTIYNLCVFLHEVDEDMLYRPFCELLKEAIVSGDDFDDEYSRSETNDRGSTSEKMEQLDRRSFIDLNVVDEEQEKGDEVELPPVRFVKWRQEYTALFTGHSLHRILPLIAIEDLLIYLPMKLATKGKAVDRIEAPLRCCCTHIAGATEYNLRLKIAIVIVLELKKKLHLTTLLIYIMCYSNLSPVPWPISRCWIQLRFWVRHDSLHKTRLNKSHHDSRW